MAGEQQVTLTREEARAVLDLYADQLDNLAAGASTEEQQRTFRLLVKLDKALGKDGRWAGPFAELPDWIREILHRTFTPQPAKPKKAAPKAPARAARKPAARAPQLDVRPMPEAVERGIDQAFPDLQRAPAAELTGSAARRKGGLLRAAAAAEAKGDKAGATQYRKRAAQLVTSAGAHRVDS